jgi:hypothetical protein
MGEMKTEAYRLLVVILLAAVLGVGLYGLTRPTPQVPVHETKVCVQAPESGSDLPVMWGDC